MLHFDESSRTTEFVTRIVNKAHPMFAGPIVNTRGKITLSPSAWHGMKECFEMNRSKMGGGIKKVDRVKDRKSSSIQYTKRL